ncbi:radical SAM family heme chaperone HemW [Lacipirellula limnantheis]|uniref:Heme chaperone HemW n=1 Tax=Lacipirellula limnantheis TaxID=2528024 RepID=A0A517TUC5_9BACT|nr:radical SAM family heme chaperone HemW [Lacipirellula limnantheis]QDT71983.1 Oxygen-independent coproporphyrinogen-III oxidase-like protein [Lacipirellula limnantheis]
MPSAPPPPRSAYIHVPFCKFRCGYCDFAIVADRDDLVGTYLQTLATELSWLGAPREVDTLYFGGGTPSHLDPASLTALCEIAKRWHPLAQGYEWTVEANPESLTADRVAVLSAQGATRLSLGVQSLDDAKLRALERNHSRHDVVRAMDLARAAEMQVSVDLMFAAPGETLEQWRRDLAAAIELRPDHISTYGLTWEPGAAFTARRDKGLLRPLDEELERAMYSQAIERLTDAGFEHYEVSNFALAGRRSRHNEVYWAGSEYFAAGPGAARYVDGVRSTNHRSTTTYLKRVQTGVSAIFEQEELAPEQRARELLVLGLRRLEGVQRSTFAMKSGFEMDQLAGRAIGKFVELGLLSDDGSRVKLTREGLFVSDALWPELL